MADKTTCEHYWSYVHAVYSSTRGGAMVRRWCHKCGAEQVGHVERWRTPHETEFDKSAPKAARDVNASVSAYPWTNLMPAWKGTIK